MGKISKWFPPFTGVIFAILVIAIGILLGTGQDATKKTAAEIVDHYKNHGGKDSVGAILIVYAAATIIFFGGWLRRFLRDAEGPGGILSAVAFGGAVAFAARAAGARPRRPALPGLGDGT